LGRNWTKADIFLWDEAGRRLAIKDYARRPAWVRATLGRWLIRRECAAYERLRGIPGIPAFAGQIDACAFAVELIEGRDLSRIRRGELPASFFPQLLALLEAVHRAGVAHGDLHHRDVILSSTGGPFLVDFSTAVFRRGAARALFEAACASDRRAALKLKSRHAPGDVTAAERQALDHPPRWYRVGKALRRMLSGGAKKRAAR
jgi:serine/threonine protein kinase